MRVGEAGRGMGRGYPPSQPTRGSGGVVSSPSGVRGGAPAENGFWCILSLKKNESGDDKFDIFVIFIAHN